MSWKNDENDSHKTVFPRSLDIENVYDKVKAHLIFYKFGPNDLEPASFEFNQRYQI